MGSGQISCLVLKYTHSFLMAFYVENERLRKGVEMGLRNGQNGRVWPSRKAVTKLTWSRQGSMVKNKGHPTSHHRRRLMPTDLSMREAPGPLGLRWRALARGPGEISRWEGSPSLTEGGREEGKSLINQSLVKCCSVSHQLVLSGQQVLVSPVMSVIRSPQS